MTRAPSSPDAEPGSVAADVLADLILLREFFANRDLALARLLGSRGGHVRLRDEMLRLAVIEFGQGRTRNLAFFVFECSALGSTSAVRNEIRRLAMFGCLNLRDDVLDTRSTLVVPTEKLVRWYCQQMPRATDEVQRIFVSKREERS